MKNFLITVDSGCDLPLSHLNELGIIPIKMKYTVDDVEYTDSMDQSQSTDFYNMMRSGSMPKTSQINPHEYIEFFKPLLKMDLPIIHISISSGVSGTYESGIAAQEMLKNDYPDSRIFIFDSTLASLGSGMFALKAAELRDKDCTFEQCINWLEDKKSSLNVYCFTGDLKYLQRGGRVSKINAFVGSMLNINVIMKFTRDGKLVAADKVRGRAGTMEKIYEILSETLLNPKEQTLYVSHSDAFEEAKKVGEELCAKYGFQNVFYSSIGSIIGSHAGPGLVAIFYYGKERSEQ